MFPGDVILILNKALTPFCTEIYFSQYIIDYDMNSKDACKRCARLFVCCCSCDENWTINTHQCYYKICHVTNTDKIYRIYQIRWIFRWGGDDKFGTNVNAIYKMICNEVILIRIDYVYLCVCVCAYTSMSYVCDSIYCIVHDKHDATLE